MGRYYIEDNEFGIVWVHTRVGMRNLRAIVKDGNVLLRVPEGASKKSVHEMIDQYRSELRALCSKYSERKHLYHDGMKINCFGGYSITLGVQHEQPGRVEYGCNGQELYVNIPSESSFENDTVEDIVSKVIKLMVRQRAERVLVPFAEKIAAQLGLKVKKFVMGHGMSKLGHCTRSGEIQLSYYLMFLPEHLIKHVVCHELAHLTYFNHSHEFHLLTDKYDDGNERADIKELKNFKWPVKR